jgi:hypothetical protein
MRRFWLLAAALSLAAAPAFAQPAFPPLRFDSQPPFRLAVGSIQIVDRDPSPRQPPRIDAMFPVPPARALETWARDRLVAAGGPNRLVFTIVRARATDTKLRLEDGTLSRAATDQVSDRYDVAAEVRLEILDPSGHAVATARAVATRYQTTLQSTSPDRLNEIWYDMTRRLMADLAPELDAQIQAHLGAYLR